MTRVIASWMPSASPAAVPVSRPRRSPWRRRPAMAKHGRGGGDGRSRVRPVRGGADGVLYRGHRPGHGQGAHPGQQDDGTGQLLGPRLLAGDPAGDDQREQQVGGQQRLGQGEDHVADDPGGQQHPGDHEAQASQPAPLPQQVGDQPGAQEVGLRHPLGRVLLQHESGAQQDRCYRADEVPHRPPTTPVSSTSSEDPATIWPHRRPAVRQAPAQAPPAASCRAPQR